MMLLYSSLYSHYLLLMYQSHFVAVVVVHRNSNIDYRQLSMLWLMMMMIVVDFVVLVALLLSLYDLYWIGNVCIV